MIPIVDYEKRFREGFVGRLIITKFFGLELKRIFNEKIP